MGCVTVIGPVAVEKGACHDRAMGMLERFDGNAVLAREP